MDPVYLRSDAIPAVPYAGEWAAGKAIKKGEFRTKDGLLFMANLAHTSTAANAPYADPAVIYARQYRGTYSAATTYAKYDSVTSAEGNQYLSLIENNLAHTPPTDGTDSAYWACYARRGPQGYQGDPGGESGLWAMQEVPTGVQDGANKTFTLHHTPTGTVTVIFNGIICQNGVDYSYSGIDLTLITFAPDAADDDKFFVWYPYYGITALLSFGDIVWQGAWNSGTTYTIGQGVTSSGHGYVSIQDSNLNHAVSEAAWWVEVGSNGMEYVTSPIVVDHADVSPVDLGLAPENSIVEPIIRCIESNVDCVLVIGDESDADSLCINASMPIAVTDPPIEGPMGKQYYSAEKYLRATITTPGAAGKWSIQFRITLVS